MVKTIVTLQSMAATRTARRLAQVHPEAALPCPLCAASLHASNLEKHLTKVHRDDSGESVPAPTMLVGRDRAIGRELVFILGALLALMALAIAIAHQSGVPLGDTPVAIAVAATLAALTAVVAAHLGAFPGRLEIHDGHVRLRYALGLRARIVKLPAGVEVGRLRTLRPEPGMQAHDWAPSTEVDAGVYLRLGDERTTITATTRKGTAFRKHWAEPGWRGAAPTRVADIELDREAMVALEYALAEAGVLAPRTA